MAINVVPVTGSGGGVGAPQQGKSSAGRLQLSPYVAPKSGLSAFGDSFNPYMIQAMKTYQDTKKRKEIGAMKSAYDAGDKDAFNKGDNPYPSVGMEYESALAKQEELKQKRLSNEQMKTLMYENRFNISKMEDRTKRLGLSLKDNWHKVDDATKRDMGKMSSEDQRWISELGYEKAMNVMKMAKEYDIKIENIRGKSKIEVENVRNVAIKNKFERENPILHRQVMEKLNSGYESAFALQDDSLQSKEYLETSGRVWKAGQANKTQVRDLAKMAVKSKYERLLEQDKQTGGLNKDRLLHQQGKEMKGIEHSFTGGQNNINRSLDKYKHDTNIEYQQGRDSLLETGRTNRHRTDVETKKIMQNNTISWEEKRIGLDQINTQANLKSKEEIDTKLQNNLGEIRSRQSSQGYTQKKLMAETKHVYNQAILQQSLYGEEARDLRKRKTSTMVAHIKKDSDEKVAKIKSLAVQNKLSNDIGFKLRTAYTKESKEFLRLQSVISKMNGALKGPQSNTSDKVVVQELLNMVQEAGKGSTKMYNKFEGSGMIGELNRVWNDLQGKESRIPHGQVVDLYSTAWDIWSNAKGLQKGRTESIREQINEAGAKDFWVTDFNKTKIPKLTPMEGTGEPVRWIELLDTVGKDLSSMGNTREAVEKAYESFSSDGETTVSDDELMKVFQ